MKTCYIRITVNQQFSKAISISGEFFLYKVGLSKRTDVIFDGIESHKRRKSPKRGAEWFLKQLIRSKLDGLHVRVSPFSSTIFLSVGGTDMRLYLHYTNTPAKKNTLQTEITRLACAVSLTAATETVRLHYNPHIHTFHEITQEN